MKLNKLYTNKFLYSLILLGFNLNCFYSQASKYEAFLTGSDEYDDATLELGLQDVLQTLNLLDQ